MNARGPIIAAGVTALCIALMAWLGVDRSPPVRVNEPARPVVEQAAAAVENTAPVVVAAPVHGAAVVPAVKKLVPKSEKWIERVDDIIPNNIYASAAECYDKKLSEQKVRIHVDIKVVGGRVFVSDAKPLMSTISDPKVEGCILTAVRNASWEDEEMPDYDGDDELLIRIDGLRKHLGQIEDDSDHYAGSDEIPADGPY